MLSARVRRIIREEERRTQQAVQEQLGNLPQDEDREPPPPKIPPQATQFRDLIQQCFNRPRFDAQDLRQSTSRHRLLPLQKSALVSWLYRESGQISAAMIVQFASYLGVCLDHGKVKALLKDARFGRFEDYQKIASQTVRKKLTDHDSDSEPEEEETDAARNASFDPTSGLAYGQMVDMVWYLRAELGALHRDVVKKELAARQEEDESRKADVPSYTQQKGIADSLVEFNRMSRVRLFGSSNNPHGHGSVSQPSVMLSFPTMSVPSEVLTRNDDSRSVSVASHGTIVGSESAGPTVRAASSLSLPLRDMYHPLKSPDVFQHFYPSRVSEETRKLPIFSVFDRIMTMLFSRRVTVISGKTGTGKTTQVPLMIMDHAAENKLPCNIIVTQPRRLAAIGVARRVCADRQWTVGQLVGYHVGLDKNTSQSTRLTYCTTGVLIERIVAAKHLNAYTHVFLDEVHERDQDTDMALMLVRQMLRENSPDVKVILMSATVEVNKMLAYFQQNVTTLSVTDQPGRVTIETQSHQVYEKFLDEFAERIDVFEFDIQHPVLSTELLLLAAETLDHLEPVDCDDNSTNQAVLVFLPGLEHICELAAIIKTRSSETEIMILHSTISGPDQEKVLVPPSSGVRRVILSTNIAESSLTIPYINYVFDFCLMKVLKLNRRTKVPQLSLEWASVSNCHQRRGRVGRVKRGRVYFFVPRAFFSSELPLHPEPEILTSPIEHSVLRVKLLKVTPPPAEVLVLLPDPPKRNDVELAILTLKQVGALTVKFSNQPSYADGELTAMGQLMARFPMDIQVAKFLVLCCIFGYAQEGVTIAAGMSVESVISTQDVLSPERCRKLHRLYSNPHANSDSLALLCAYERWTEQCEKGTLKSRLDEKRWCESQLIDVSRMKEFVALRREVWHRLSQHGTFTDAPSSKPVSRDIILPLLLAGAFYPNILVNQSAASGDLTVGKELLGYDPLCTCMIPRFGYATACQAPLYDAQLKALLGLNKCPDSVARVIYGSRDTFIAFSRHSGNIGVGADYSTSIHQGVRILSKRMHAMQGTLPLRDQGDSAELRRSCTAMDENRVIDSDLDSRFCVAENIVRLPPPNLSCQTARIPVVISDAENVELLWLARWDEQAERVQLDLNKAISDLAERKYLRPAKREDLLLLNSYLSRHKESESEFSRVTLFSLPDEQGNVQILLVDLGVVDRVPANWLYILPAPVRTMPRACFEFIFSGLRFIPSRKSAAADCVQQFVAIDDSELTLEVEAITDGVVRGTLFCKSARLNGLTVNLNEEMVKLGYAYSGIEPWIAEYDRKRRLKGPVVSLPSSYDVQEKEVPRTPTQPNQVLVGPVHFPARANLMAIDRRKLLVSVEPGSLNAFTYDRYPEDRCWPYRPLVCSRLVHVGARDNRLKAYTTTVLSTEPGLIGLLTMVFAPYVEMIEEQGEYVGVLTGLGPYPGKTHSFYPDCEVELPFDGAVHCEDVMQANNLRSKMNTVLRVIAQDNPDQSSAMDDLQVSCVKALMNLVRKPRRLRPASSTSRFNWRKTNHDLTDDAAALAFLVPIEYDNLSDETNANLFRNIMALHQSLVGCMENRYSTDGEPRESRCLLCNLQLPDDDILINHVFSPEHQAKERPVLGLKAN